MATLVNTHLAENRGKPRVWVEGTKLKREGIEPGMRYNITQTDKSLTLVFTNEGTFVVNKRTKNDTVNPLIELRDKSLYDLFETGQKLRVTVCKDRIVVTAHHMSELVQRRVSQYMDNIVNDGTFRVASGYHGGGGLDVAVHDGLKMAGLKSKIGVVFEQNGAYLDSSLRNNSFLYDKRSLVIESDVRDLRFSSKDIPQSDFCVLGIPCQAASKSGRSKNGHWGDTKGGHAESHSDAGGLVFNALEFIKASNAAVVIIENVEPYADTASAEIIRSVLQSLHYHMAEVTLTGTDYGSLEKRTRWSLVAISEGFEDYGLDINDLDLTAIPQLRTAPENIAAILEDVPLDSDAWKRAKYLEDKEKRDIEAGKGFRRQLIEPVDTFVKTIGKFYAKIRSTEPLLKHPNFDINQLIRLFTPVEHARLKGFCDSFVAGNSATVAHEILGQSVIHHVFEALAFTIGRFFKPSDQYDLPLAA